MAVISRRRGYLFIHTPRTGGTALAEGVLVPSLEGRYIPRKRIELPTHRGATRLIRQHSTLAQIVGAGLLDRAVADNLFKFTTVRNPFDSLVSLYVKKRSLTEEKTRPWMGPSHQNLTTLAKESPTFTDFLERRFGRNPKPRHLLPQYLEGMDFIMRFERLQEDFDHVLERIGCDERLEIPRSNVTGDRERDYRPFYTPRAREILEQVFAPDLERFGYEF